MIINGTKRLGCALASLAFISVALSALVVSTASADTTGSATAQGVSVNLNASLAGISVVNANALIGNVASPPSTSQSALSLSGAGGLGTTSAGAVNVNAATTNSLSEGSAQITGLNYSLLGAPLLQGNGNVISADASCPTAGQPTASTNLAGLQVLGQAVNVSANTPAVTVSTAVAALPPVVGLTSATLNATVSSTTQTTSTSAQAIAVNVNLTMTATILGTTTTVPVGNITLANVTCNAATTTSTTGTTGSPTPPATGSTTPSSGSPTAPSSGTATSGSTPASGGVTTPAASSPTASSAPGAKASGPTRASSVTATPGSPVFAATTVHTGEPWAGSEPYVLALLALGGALIALGEIARRRSRHAVALRSPR